MGIQQIRDDLRFRLDGLRLHPHRRLIMAALIGGVVGVIAIVVTVANMMADGPGPAQPPKPLGMLPEVPDAGAKVKSMSEVTGLSLPSGMGGTVGAGSWRLVACRAGSPPEGPGTKTWVFMLAGAEGKATKVAEVRKLAPKPGEDLSSGGALLAEAMSIELGRLAVGKPLSGWSSGTWDAPGGGGSGVRLDLLELDKTAIARVVWMEHKR